MTVEGETPMALSDNIVRGINVLLIVPTGSKALYKSADYWKDFTFIAELDELAGNKIEFADKTVEELCIANWDFNGDGQLSEGEASLVSTLGTVFTNSSITSFDELRYFTGLTSIGVTDGYYYEGFYNCNNLKSVTIPSGVTTIGRYAFNYCYNLKSLAIPSTVTNFENWAIYPYRLNYVTVNWDTPITVNANYQNSPSNITLIVPDGCKDAYQAADYWKNFNAIVEVSELAGNKINFADAAVEELCLANWDMDGNGELSENEAALVANLNGVFGMNEEITTFDELQFFTGLQSLSTFEFSGCQNLSSIILPSSLTSIGNLAFARCEKLTEITIPAQVASIGGDVFYNCGLTTLQVDENNTHYDSRENCNAIIETSSNKLIAGCTNTLIPNSVTTIGSHAFYGSKFTSLTIPNNIVTIEDEAIVGCSNLTSIVVADGNTVYDSRNNCNAIIETETNKLLVGCQNTEIPDDITSIGMSAFEGINNLKSIVIPNGVSSIGDYAFYGSDLKSIKIPGSVTTIGTSAFYNCRNLAFVNIEDITSPLAIDEFSFTNQANATLYVPIGSKATYEAADHWKEFKEILELDSENMESGDVNDDGTVSPADAVMILYNYFQVDQSGFYEPIADLNNDGIISPADAIEALYIYFNAGSQSRKMQSELDPQ